MPTPSINQIQPNNERHPFISCDFLPPLSTLAFDGEEQVNVIDASVQQSYKPSNSEQENLASRLITLSNLLDSREKKLHDSELKLTNEKKTVYQYQSALSSVETCARKHLSDLFNDIASRQKSLSSRELRLLRMRHKLESRLAATSQLLSEATDVGRQLSASRAELADLRKQLDDHRAALKDARNLLIDARAQREHALSDTCTLLEDRRKLEVATNRLEQLDACLKDRESSLARREAEINTHNTLTSKLADLQRVVAPLQMLLGDLAAVDNISVPDVASDTFGAIDTVLVLLADARARIRSVVETRRQLDVQRAHLEERTHALQAEFASLRERQVVISADERRISGIRHAIERSRLDSETAMRTVTEIRAQLETREENVRSREEQLLVSENNLSHRENSVAFAERTLAQKERSIARAQGIIEMREQALDRRIRDLDTERGIMEGQRKELELRERLLDTRELELSVLQTDDKSKPEAAFIDSPHSQQRKTCGNVCVSGTNQLEGSQHLVGAVQSTADTITRIETDGDSKRNEDHQNNGEQLDISIPTVRRQLAFESSVRNISNSSRTAYVSSPKEATDRSLPEPGEGLKMTKESETERTLQKEDDESEDAAEQLLPELLSVRSLWMERIARLEDVVNVMCEQPTMRPHIQSALVSAEQELQTLLEKVEMAPPPMIGVATHREAYVREQRAQMCWGDLLRQQLDVVREVQTGLLIGIRDNHAEGDRFLLREGEHDYTEGANSRIASAECEEVALEKDYCHNQSLHDLSFRLLRNSAFDKLPVGRSLYSAGSQFLTEDIEITTEVLDHLRH